eukprot:s1331_g27.t1
MAAEPLRELTAPLPVGIIPFRAADEESDVEVEVEVEVETVVVEPAEVEVDAVEPAATAVVEPMPKPLDPNVAYEVERDERNLRRIIAMTDDQLDVHVSQIARAFELGDGHLTQRPHINSLPEGVVHQDLPDISEPPPVGRIDNLMVTVEVEVDVDSETPKPPAHPPPVPQRALEFWQHQGNLHMHADWELNLL